MKILHLIYDHVDNPWCGGGGARRVAEVNRRLAARGRDITVVHGRFPGARTGGSDGVDWRPVGTAAAYVPSRLSYAVGAAAAIRRIPADIVVNEVSFFAPVFADWYTSRPVVNVIHHLMGRHALRLNPAVGWFSLLAETGFMAAARNIITSALAVREEIAGRFPEKTVTNIANGVPDDYFSLLPTESPFILFLGRIDIYMKGLDVLLDAFSGLPDRNLRLKIAGSGKAGDVRRLGGMVAASGAAGQVDLLGRVSETEKRELLRSCLFLAMPSRFEGWGITAVEANAAGKPVVATKITGLSEAVGEGAGAVMVPPGDVLALRRAMGELIADGSRRQQLGRQGRAHARQWSWEIIAREQLAFYRRVIEGQNI